MTQLTRQTDPYYPWQQQARQLLWRQHEREQLHHAYLILAPLGSGQLAFANTIAQALLCDTTTNQISCGHCASCQYITAHTHPDYFLIQTQSDSKIIKIDQIRALVAKMIQTRVYGRYKVAIIDGVDQLNTAAANSLLKSLEEPTANTLFLLTASKRGKIPATLQSRCQLLRFTDAIGDQASQDWLKQKLSISPSQAKQLLETAAGGILLAYALGKQDFLQQREDLIKDLASTHSLDSSYTKLAKKYLDCFKDRIPLLLTTWLEINHQLAIITSGGESSWAEDCLSAQQLMRRAQGLPIDKLLDFSCLLQQSIQHFESPINKQLALEDLFLTWNQLFKRVK